MYGEAATIAAVCTTPSMTAPTTVSGVGESRKEGSRVWDYSNERTYDVGLLVDALAVGCVQARGEGRALAAE